MQDGGVIALLSTPLGQTWKSTGHTQKLRSVYNPLGEPEVTLSGQRMLRIDNEAMIVHEEMVQAANRACIPSMAVTGHKMHWHLAYPYMAAYGHSVEVRMDEYEAGSSSTIVLYHSHCHALRECLTRWKWEDGHVTPCEFPLFHMAIAETLIQIGCRLPASAAHRNCTVGEYAPWILHSQKLLQVP